MYLYAKKGIASIDYTTSKMGEFSKKLNPDYTILASLMGATDWVTNPDSFAFAQVSLQVGYWRKANAIHNWFVQELADGEDNCNPIYVPRSSLVDLNNICKEILKNHDKAGELLPTGAGFFFGSTNYDEWYFHQLETTVPILTKLIETVPEGWSFEYQASW